MLVAIRLYSKNVPAVTLAQSMLKSVGYQLTIDGDFGKNTEKQVIKFQSKNKLVNDGIIAEKTWHSLFICAKEYLVINTNKFLSEGDLQKAANKLGIELAAIKAVNEVESRGKGFIANHPVILFERHKFWKQLKKHGINPANFVNGNHDILNTKAGGYKGGVKEITRLERAMSIHPEAAMESASWGLFQVMGYHWKKLGYASIHDFVEQMKTREAAHLDAFSRYIVIFKCIDALRLDIGNKLVLNNFSKFAHCYNGPNYKVNHYHTKMLKAYNKYRIQERSVFKPTLAATG